MSETAWPAETPENESVSDQPDSDSPERLLSSAFRACKSKINTFHRFCCFCYLFMVFASFGNTNDLWNSTQIEFGTGRARLQQLWQTSKYINIPNFLNRLKMQPTLKRSNCAPKYLSTPSSPWIQYVVRILWSNSVPVNTPKSVDCIFAVL